MQPALIRPIYCMQVVWPEATTWPAFLPRLWHSHTRDNDAIRSACVFRSPTGNAPSQYPEEALVVTPDRSRNCALHPGELSLHDL